jgi:hypothetical protein
MTLTAEFIKDIDDTKSGVAQKLWRLSRPIEYGWEDDADTTEYVVTSAAGWGVIYETYIFPADAAGKIIDWGELDGSFQGGLDHDLAIKGLCAWADQ